MMAFALILGAYILGSVPFALMIGKGIYRVDVRERGSGNIGTTNVFRVLGKKAGALVFILDLLKGFAPVFLALRLVSDDNAALVAVLAAGAAIAGHTFSIFLKFRGGKGVATGGGAILALMPVLFLMAFAFFWLVLLAGRFVSVASLSAAAFLSIAVFVTGQPRPYIVFTLAGTAMIFYAHRANIARLANGSESRVAFPWNRG
ncbi:MAG: glycerol-3-phosphate 1-O-acyltransferase PlsY [Thermoleophilia bacterium]